MHSVRCAGKTEPLGVINTQWLGFPVLQGMFFHEYAISGMFYNNNNGDLGLCFSIL